MYNMYKMYIMKSWLTIREVAEALSLSREMIYKLAKQGKIPAIQIGSSWRIHREDFESWLKNKRNPEPLLRHPVLHEFKKLLEKYYGNRFLDLYVYGSVARGEETKESDIDTLVLLKNYKSRWKELKIIREMAYQVSFEKGFDVVVSTMVATEEELNIRQDPLFCRIREEGVKAA